MVYVKENFDGYCFGRDMEIHGSGSEQRCGLPVFKMWLSVTGPGKKVHEKGLEFRRLLAVAVAGVALLPLNGYATQLHSASEGIITHQGGHIFFLFSMVALIFTLTGKGLDKQKGWRLIRYSAVFFILWNLDVILAHLLDNQIHAVTLETISLDRIKVVVRNDSAVLASLYYALKLDHLLCVPALLFFYLGLSSLVNEQRQTPAGKDVP